MYERFPLDSKMTVYYHPANPNLAYVERYAQNYTWLIFLIVAIVFIVTILLTWLIVSNE